jgi:hypothetical protein
MAAVEMPMNGTLQSDYPTLNSSANLARATKSKVAAKVARHWQLVPEPEPMCEDWELVATSPTTEATAWDRRRGAGDKGGKH